MKKKLIVPLVILLVLIVTLISSVAFFSYATEGQTESSIQIGELTFKYTEVDGKGQGINLDDAYPLSDTEGKGLSEYFDFKVEGNLTRSDLTYTVELDTTLSDLPDSGIKLYLTEIKNGNEVELNSIVNTLLTYQASDNGRIIYSETIPRNTKNYVKNFRLRMWIDESVDWTDDLYMGHSGTFKVNVKANSNTSVAATDVVTDRTTSLERIVANDKYLFTSSSDQGVDYEVTVPYTVNNVDIEVYESNTQATSVVTPINSLSGVSSKSTTQNIHTGNNYFKVTTTASNGTTTGEHILKVVKEADTNNDLLNLGVEGYSLTPVFDKDTLAYTLTLEEPSITITGNKESDTASITGLGEKTLVFGENVFNITVRSESGVDKTYTITVTNSRPIAPAITGGTGTTWVSTNQTITLANPNPAFAISGIDHYEVYDTNTSTAPTDSTVATTTTTGSYTVDTDGIHYIYYRTVSNKGFKSVWSSAQIVYRDASAPTAVTLTASDTKASNTWHGNDYEITISATKNGGSNLTYYYGTSSNPTEEGNIIPASGNTTGTTYYAKACNEAGVCSTNGTYISKIDKTAPTGLTMTASDDKASNTWHSGSYTISVSATKAGVSDVSYYHGETNNPTTSGSSISASGNTTGKTYYAKACNEAGVCTSVGSYISKIDSSAPTNLAITASDNISSGDWHTANFTLNFSATKNGGSNITYYHGSNLNNATAGSSKTFNSSTNATYYMKACNEAGVCSTTNASYVVRLDKSTAGAPTITGGSSSWSTSARTISVSTAGTSYSNVSTYEYYKTPSTTAPNADTKATGTTSGNLSVGDEGVTYVYYRTVAVSGKKSSWTSAQTVKRDTTGPTTPTSGAIGSITSAGSTGTIATAAGGSTDAGVGGITYKYMVTNSSSAPANTNSNFTTSRNFSRSCGKTYYAYAIAVDSLGNKSGVKSLGSASDIACAAYVGSTHYFTVQDAIDSTNSGTVVVEKNVTENLTISSGKSIVLNNSKTITGTITNAGTLKITSSGKVTSSGQTVTNTGNLNLSGNTIESTGSRYTGVDNTGLFTMESGTITTKGNSLVCAGSLCNVLGGTIQTSSSSDTAFWVSSGDASASAALIKNTSAQWKNGLWNTGSGTVKLHNVNIQNNSTINGRIMWTEISSTQLITRYCPNTSKPNGMIFPTWSDKNGQDDIRWYYVGSTISVLGSSCFQNVVNFSDHNNDSGVYYVHVYNADSNHNPTTADGDACVTVSR